MILPHVVFNIYDNEFADLIKSSKIKLNMSLPEYKLYSYMNIVYILYIFIYGISFLATNTNKKQSLTLRSIHRIYSIVTRMSCNIVL